MKVLVVYDSMFGNTEKVAKSIGTAINADVSVLKVSDAPSFDLSSIDLLVVGSPTHGFRATKSIQTFMKNIPENALTGINVAAFDTRLSASDTGRGLRFLMKIGGYAAPRIANALKKKGGILVGSPEGFLVTGKEGPLKEGELDRAVVWAKTIAGDDFQQDKKEHGFDRKQ